MKRSPIARDLPGIYHFLGIFAALLGAGVVCGFSELGFALLVPDPSAEVFRNNGSVDVEKSTKIMSDEAVARRHNEWIQTGRTIGVIAFPVGLAVGLYVWLRISSVLVRSLSKPLDK